MCVLEGEFHIRKPVESESPASLSYLPFAEGKGTMGGWVSVVAALVLGLVLVGVWGIFSCLVVLSLLIRARTRGRVNLIPGTPWLSGVRNAAIHFKSCSSCPFDIYVKLSLARFRLAWAINNKRTAVLQIPSIMLQVSALQCRVFWCGTHVPTKAHVVQRPKSGSYCQLVGRLLLIAIVNGISRIITVAFEDVDALFSFPLDPCYDDSSAFSETRGSGRGGVNISRRGTTSGTSTTPQSEMYSPAEQNCDEASKTVSHLLYNLGTKDSEGRGTIRASVQSVLVRSTAVKGLNLTMTISAKVARLCCSCNQPLPATTTRTTGWAFPFQRAPPSEGNDVSCERSSFETFACVGTKLCDHPLLFLQHGVTAVVQYESSIDSSANLPRVLGVRHISLKFGDPSPSGSVKEQGYFSAGCEIQLPLNILASFLDCYGKWERENKYKRNPVDSAEGSVSQNGAEEIQKRSIAPHNRHGVLFSISTNCYRTKVSIIERSHPSIAVVEIMDLCVRAAVPQPRSVSFSFEAKESKFFSEAHGTLPSNWWRSLKNCRSPMELDPLKRTCNEMSETSEGTENTPSHSPWRFEAGSLPSWNVNVNVFRNSADNVIVRRVRINVFEAALFWIPDGIVVWIHLIIHTLNVYRSARDCQNPGRSSIRASRSRRYNPLSFQSKCIRCDHVAGSRLCHAGSRPRLATDFVSKELPPFSWSKNALRQEDTYPAAVPLESSFCDISKLINAVLPCLNSVESISKDSFDLRIGRLWVFFDPLASTTAATSDNTETCASNAGAIVAQADHVVLHNSSFSGAPLWWCEGCRIYVVDSRSSRPPCHFPAFAAQCFTSTQQSCFVSQVDTEKPDEWMLCLATGHLAVIRSAVPVCLPTLDSAGTTPDRLRRFVTSIHMKSMQVYWSPIIVEAAWLIMEQLLVDTLAIKHWCLLTIHDFPFPPKGAFGNDFYITVGCTSINLFNALTVKLSSFFLYRDGDSGTIDMGMGDISVYMEKKAKEVTFGNDFSESITQCGCPPLLVAQHLRIWMGHEAFSVDQTTREALNLAFPAPNVAKCVTTELCTNSDSIVKSIKVEVHGLQLILRPECPFHQIQHDIVEPLLTGLIPRLTSRITITRLFRIASNYAAEGNDIRQFSRPPIRQYSLKSHNTSLVFLTGLTDFSAKTHQFQWLHKNTNKPAEGNLSMCTVSRPNDSITVEQLPETLTKDLDFTAPFRADGVEHSKFFTHDWCNTSRSYLDIYTSNSRDVHGHKEGRRSWLNVYGQYGGSAAGLSSRSATTVHQRTKSVEFWCRIACPMILITMGDLLYDVQYPSKETPEQIKTELQSVTTRKKSVLNEKDCALLSRFWVHILRLKGLSLICSTPHSARLGEHFSSIPFLSFRCEDFSGNFSSVYGVQQHDNLDETTEPVFFTRKSVLVRQFNPVFIEITGAFIPLNSHIQSWFLPALRHWCRNTPTTGTKSHLNGSPKICTVLSWNVVLSRGIQLSWRIGGVRFFGRNVYEGCDEPIPVLRAVIPRCMSEGMIQWKPWTDWLKFWGATYGKNALAQGTISLLQLAIDLPQGFFLSAAGLDEDINCTGAAEYRRIMASPACRLVDVYRCTFNLEVNVNNASHSLHDDGLPTDSALPSRKMSSGISSSELSRLPLDLGISIDVHGPDPLMVVECGEPLDGHCCCLKSDDQSSTFFGRGRIVNEETTEPAFTTVISKCFPSNLFSPVWKYHIREPVCAVCCSPLLINMHPETVLAILQCVLPPASCDIGISGNPCDTNLHELTQSGIQMPPAETCCEASQEPQSRTFSSSSIPHVSNSSSTTHQNILETLQYILRNITLEIKASVKVSHAYVRLGTIRINAASIFLENVSFLKTHKQGILHHFLTNGEVCFSWLRFCVILFLEELQSECYVGARHLSMAIEYRNIPEMRVLQCEKRCNSLQQPLPFRAVSHRALPTMLPPGLPSTVVPILRIRCLQIQLTSATDLIVTVDRCRSVVNVLTVPVLYHAIHIWDVLRPAISAYTKRQPQCRRTSGVKTNTSSSRGSTLDDSPAEYIPLRRFLEKFHCLRLSIRCNKLQTNVHWLDLSTFDLPPSVPEFGEYKFRTLSKGFTDIPQYFGYTSMGKPPLSKTVIETLDLLPCRHRRPLEVLRDTSLFWTDDLFTLSSPTTVPKLSILGGVGFLDSASLGKACRYNSSATIAEFLESASIGPLLQCNSGWCLATEAAELCQTSDGFSKNNTVDVLQIDPYNRRFSLSAASSRRDAFFRLLEHARWTTEPKMPERFSGVRNAIPSEVGALQRNVDAATQISFGSRLETSLWNTVRSTTGWISWRGAVRPTEACQLVVATSQIKIEVTFDLNLAALASFPDCPDLMYQCPEISTGPCACDVFALLTLRIATEPLIGSTSELHLRGLLWVDDRTAETSTLVAAAPSENVSSGKGHTASAEQSKSEQIQPREIMCEFVKTEKSTAPALRLQQLLPFEQPPASRLLKEMLRTSGVTITVNASVPVFSESTVLKVDVPVVIVTCTSVAAQQVVHIGTMVLLNTDFLPQKKVRKPVQLPDRVHRDLSLPFDDKHSPDYSRAAAQKNCSAQVSSTPFSASGIYAPQVPSTGHDRGTRLVGGVSSLFARLTRRHQRHEGTQLNSTISRNPEIPDTVSRYSPYDGHMPYVATPGISGIQNSFNSNKDELTGNLGTLVDTTNNEDEAKFSAAPVAGPTAHKRMGRRRLVNFLERYFAWETMKAQTGQQQLTFQAPAECSSTHNCSNCSSPRPEYTGLSLPRLTETSSQDHCSAHELGSAPSEASPLSSASRLSGSSFAVSSELSLPRDANSDASVCSSPAVFLHNDLDDADDELTSLNASEKNQKLVKSEHDPRTPVCRVRTKLSSAFVVLHLEYSIQQVTISLVKNDYIFSRCSGAYITGSVTQSLSSGRECCFDMDIKDIFIDSVHPSRYSATTSADHVREGEDDNDQSEQKHRRPEEKGSEGPGLDNHACQPQFPVTITPSRATATTLASRQPNIPILMPLVSGSETACSIFSLRGQSRVVRISLAGAVLGQGEKQTVDAPGLNEPEMLTLKVYETFILKIQPVQVNLTQKLIDNLYGFIFSPSPIQSSQQAIALVNPRIPFPVEMSAPVRQSWRGDDETIEHTIGEAELCTLRPKGGRRSRTSPAIPKGHYRKCSRKDRDPAALVYFKFFRIAPVVAVVNFSGGAITLENVKLQFKPFTQKGCVQTFKKIIDRYMWYLGRQATTTVISHKVRGWMAEKKRRFRLRSPRAGVLPLPRRMSSSVTTPSVAVRRPENSAGPPLGWLR